MVSRLIGLSPGQTVFGIVGKIGHMEPPPPSRARGWSTRSGPRAGQARRAWMAECDRAPQKSRLNTASRASGPSSAGRRVTLQLDPML